MAFVPELVKRYSGRSNSELRDLIEFYDRQIKVLEQRAALNEMNDVVTVGVSKGRFHNTTRVQHGINVMRSARRDCREVLKYRTGY